MSTVLVVGSGSPLGTAVATAFRDAGYEVHGASRTGRGGAEVVDISDELAARELLERTRPEVVVSLARPDLPAGSDAADQVIVRSVDALAGFARQCQTAGAGRLLFASSAAVYGTEALTPRTETDPTPAPSRYARLKLLSERALSTISDELGFSAVALRIFNVYGPGFSRSLVNRLLAAASGGPAPTVFATDEFVRDYVHADDVASAFVAAAAAPTPPPVVLNVGTGVGTDTLELLSLFPDVPWLPSDELESASISVADVTLLSASLGYVPPARLADVLGSSPTQK